MMGGGHKECETREMCMSQGSFYCVHFHLFPHYLVFTFTFTGHHGLYGDIMLGWGTQRVRDMGNFFVPRVSTSISWASSISIYPTCLHIFPRTKLLTSYRWYNHNRPTNPYQGHLFYGILSVFDYLYVGSTIIQGACKYWLVRGEI